MRSTTMLSVFLVAAAASAFGHGVQIQITFNATTDQIETREIVHTDARPATITDLKRVYVMPLMPFVGGAGDGWYSRPDDTRDIFGLPLHPTGPGICYQYDADDQLPGTGWSFSGSDTLPNLQGSNFGYAFTDALKFWDSAAFIDPGVEQMQIFRGDGTAVPTIMSNTSDAPPFGTIALSTINTRSNNPHHSLGYRMLGDGQNPGLDGLPAGDDGVYLLSLQVTSTAVGVNASEPFYHVLFKNVPPAEALAAAESLGFPAEQIQFVPEPSSLLLVLAAVGLSRRRAAWRYATGGAR